MFSEKNLPTLIVLTPIITITSFAALMIYFVITTQYDNFAKEVAQFESEYMQRQKSILQEENEKVHSFINYHIQADKKQIHSELNTRLSDASAKISKIHEEYKDLLGRQELLAKAKEVLSSALYEKNEGFYFLVDTNNEALLLSTNTPAISSKDRRVFLETVQKKTKKEIWQFVFKDAKQIHKKVDFISYKLPLEGVILGAANYTNKAKERLKNQIVTWMESVRYGTHGYVWVHDTDYHLVAHPFRQASIGNNDINGTDSSGALIFKDFIRTALSDKDGGFVEYYWARPDFGAPAKKIGFLKHEPYFDWVIGTGLYVDDIESFIAKKKKELEGKIDRYVQIIVLTALALTSLFGLISYILSKTAVNVFQEYRQKVINNENSLKELNASLSDRIDAALLEAKKKDQAMLHQSRLAQMGEMLSMIAHQWRQPLMEISAIFMELQSASKFNKASNEYIQKQSKEANQLIGYMSRTIEDFKDFFKPKKKREHFSITKACKEALTLCEASLKSKAIHVKLHVTQDSTVFGYPSEYAQVILNLILNARDALTQRDIYEPRIDIYVHVKQENAIVEVSDNAGGVPEEIQKSIFEPYFSTKESSGMGLGLYMSKMIIENNMDGKLNFTNSAYGAIFEVSIKVE